MTLEAWTLRDCRTGAPLGTKAYPTLAAALATRRALIERAGAVSRECAAEAVECCDVRKEPKR